MFGIDAADPLVKSTIDNLKAGWHSLSTAAEISDLSIFNSAKIVWYFNSDSDIWQGYSSNSITQAAIVESGVSTITVITAKGAVWVEK